MSIQYNFHVHEGLRYKNYARNSMDTRVDTVLRALRDIDPVTQTFASVSHRRRSREIWNAWKKCVSYDRQPKAKGDNWTALEGVAHGMGWIAVRSPNPRIHDLITHMLEDATGEWDL